MRVRAGRRIAPATGRRWRSRRTSRRPHLVEDAARDLDAFASFTGRREEPDVALRLALLDLAGEHAQPKRREIGVPVRPQHLGLQPQPFESVERRDVAERHRHEHVRARRSSSARRMRTRRASRAGRRAARAARTGWSMPAAPAAPPRLEWRSRTTWRDPRGRGGELLLEPLEQGREIGPAERQAAPAPRTDPASRSSCSVRASARGKPASSRPARSSERAVPSALESGARRHRLGSSQVAGESRRPRGRRSEPRRQLREAEPVQSPSAAEESPTALSEGY